MAWRGGTLSEELTICAFTCSERPSKKMVGKHPAQGFQMSCMQQDVEYQN